MKETFDAISKEVSNDLIQESIEFTLKHHEPVHEDRRRKRSHVHRHYGFDSEAGWGSLSDELR